MKKKKRSYWWRHLLGLAGIFAGLCVSALSKVAVVLAIIIAAVIINPDGYVGVQCNYYIWLYEDMGLNRTKTDLKQYCTEVPADSGETGEYTLMVYMLGTDLETNYGAGTSDIVEMLQAELAEGVRVVLYTGGAYYWNNNLISAKKNQVYLIDSNGIRLVHEFDRQNMANPEVLTDFITYARQEFPAKHESLILWDHGDGPIWGFGYTQNTSDDDIMMSVAELDEALDAALAGDKLDFLAFDACLMGSLEILDVVSDYTDCMIASPEATSGLGFGYTDILNGISQNPGANVFSIGEVICDAYADGVAEDYEDSIPLYQALYSEEILICTYDCTKADKAVKALNALSERLMEDYTAEEILSAAALVKSYGYGSFDMIDAGMWASLYMMDYPEAYELNLALRDMVTYLCYSADIGYSSGVALYYPHSSASALFLEDGSYEEYQSIDWGGDVYMSMVDLSAQIVQESEERDILQIIIDSIAYLVGDEEEE